MTKSRKELEFNKRNKNLCNLQKVFLASGKSDACLDWKEIRLEPTWCFYVFQILQANLISFASIQFLMLATLRINVVLFAF